VVDRLHAGVEGVAQLGTPLEPEGEDLGPEFEEVVGRLEAGEDPESIEDSMPDLGSAQSSDDFGVM
jgi:hypothetical protein